MVELQVEGKACTLSNNRLAVTFSEEGKAVSMVFDGRELMQNLSGAAGDPDRTNSFYCDYHVGGVTRNLVPTRLEVRSETPSCAHVAYVDDQSDLKLAYHLVMVDDVPAVYGYVVAACDVPGVTINELRTVYRFDSTVFTCGYTARRQGLQPHAEYMAQFEKLQDETFRFPDACKYTNSDVYSKYDYAGYFADNDMWGQYGYGLDGEGYGAWFIPLDKSCYPGGPLKQDLLVHYDSIILNYLTGAHFGTGDFDVPEGWQKLYGPWCLYVNRGRDVVADAQERVRTEHAALPVSWIDETDLYTGDYAQVTGSLALVNDFAHPEGWTVVATDEPGNYFRQKAGRIYYTTTEQDAFTLERMQPGHYWIYAYLNKTSDATEYLVAEVDVAPQQELDLGVCTVENTVLPLIWQVGAYSRTTEPFVFSDQLRNYIWMGLTPKNLTYRVGTDDDWYYLQRDGGRWVITFDRPQVVAQSYRLTVCLAAATLKTMISGVADAAFFIDLNGRQIIDAYFENDRAAYRSSVTGGEAHTIEVGIPFEAFADHNELAFRTPDYVMYDMIKLEAVVA